MIFVRVVYIFIFLVEVVGVCLGSMLERKKPLIINNFIRLQYKNKSRMSISSLPDIFKKATIEPIVFRKQGPPFALRLTSQSVGKISHSRAIYLPGNEQYSTLQVPKRRSASTASVRPKQAILKDENHSKPGTARDKMQVSFKEQLQFSTGSAIKCKAALSVLQTSNFPYETNRKMNNMTIDLEQSESLKNKTNFNLNEMKVICDTFEQTKSIATQIRVGLLYFGDSLGEEIDGFQAQFSEVLRECYGNLSKLRRSTNQGLKSNRLELDRLEVEMTTCANFCSDLTAKSEKMYAECLDNGKETEERRAASPSLDFEEISSIPKQSRGATGDQSRRTRVMDLWRKEPRRTSWDLVALKPEGVTLNGKEVQILSFQQN